MEIIIPIVIVLTIIGFLVYASKSGAKLIKQRQERINRAENGKAKIISCTGGSVSGTGEHGRYQSYNFSLEVWNEYKVPYSAETVWEVYDMGVPKVQEGMEVNIKIDAEDTSVIYPNIQFVKYSWLGSMLKDKKSKSNIH
jgi:hypothetical protein